MHIFFNFADCKIDNNKTSAVDKSKHHTHGHKMFFTGKPLKDKTPKALVIHLVNEMTKFFNEFSNPNGFVPQIHNYRR